MPGAAQAANPPPLCARPGRRWYAGLCGLQWDCPRGLNQRCGEGVESRVSSSCAEVEGGSVVHASERVGCIWPQGLGMSTDQQELSKRSHQEQQPKPAASCLGAHITRAAQRSHVRCTSTCVPCIGSCQSSLLSGAPQRRPSAAPLPSGSAPLSQGGYSGKPATCPTHR